MNYENLHPNITVRRCSHCRCTGHRIDNCHIAYTDGMTLHDNIITIIHRNLLNQECIEISIYVFLNSLNVSKLKLITYYISVGYNINNLISDLHHNSLITLEQANMNTKRNILLVLGHYYKQFYAHLRPLPPPLPSPLINRFNRYENQNHVLRKFNIEIQVVSDKQTTFECPICIEEIKDKNRITTNCNHDVCSSCFDKYLTNLQKTNYENPSPSPCCCLCRTTIVSLKCTDVECSKEMKEKFLN